MAHPQSFEQLHPRAVAVVIDPIQSVRGKVVIDAFRSINPQSLIAGQESRQTTSNIGHLNKPSIQALIHGLNRHYYSESAVSSFAVDIAPASTKLETWLKLETLRSKERSLIAGLAIDYRKTEAEQGMLLNLHKRGWTEGLKLRDFGEMKEGNEKAVKVSRTLHFIVFARSLRLLAKSSLLACGAPKTSSVSPMPSFVLPVYY